PGRIDTRPADDDAAVLVRLGGDLLEAELLRGVLGGADAAVLVLQLVGRHAPRLGGPLEHLPLDVLGGLVGGPAGGVGDAAAAGHVGVADAVGVRDGRPHVLGPQAQRLGQLHRDRGAGAADVGRTLDQADRAVGVDAGADRRLQADVEPE